MLAFAFDRDWTVDVNPHPHHDAVPLEWVRYLAHETDHAVFAIGNQNLAEEAAIPGVVDIVGRHPDNWDDWLGAKQPDGHYEQFPLRRERLALIEDLHPEADRYIVVDDRDLSDVEAWEHLHAWDFVPAVESGSIDPALPWTTDSDGGDEPVTDGGVVKSAGIMPVDASHLSSFLDSDRGPVRREAAGRVAAIAVEFPAAVEPSVDDIAALLTVEDTRTRINATGTLARVADDFPESVAHLTPTFVELLSDDDHRVRDNACWALGYLQAAEAHSALDERLQDESNETVRNSVAWALSEIETA